MQVGGGGALPAQADASGEEGAYGAVRLVGLAGAGGAGDQQRGALGDAGSARAGPSGAGDVVGPGGDLGVVGQGAAVAGGDAGVRQLQCRDRLGRRLLGGSSGGVDAAAGQDAVEPVGERADALGCVGEGGRQSSSPYAATTSVGFVHARWAAGVAGDAAFMTSWTRLGRTLGCRPLTR